LLTCAHTAWKSTSAPLFFCSSGKETVENLKISRGQLAPCQKNGMKQQQTVSSAGCKVLVPNAGFLLVSMPSYCRFKPIECSYSESVSVSVPQDKIRGSAILLLPELCPGGKRQRLTVNNSTLLVKNDNQKAFVKTSPRASCGHRAIMLRVPAGPACS